MTFVFTTSGERDDLREEAHHFQQSIKPFIPLIISKETVGFHRLSPEELKVKRDQLIAKWEGSRFSSDVVDAIINCDAFRHL